MSDYEPFDATQGDPWSTEPVGDFPRQKRTKDPETYQDESQVLARMPHVGDEPSPDQYRQQGHAGSSHRRRRSPSRRPGIPAPVWVVVGMGLVALIAIPFIMAKNSGGDTAVDMPAPDADMAPVWSPDNTDSQWRQQPDNWAQDPTATVAAEPTATAAWNTTGDWVGAPPNALYANNAGDMNAQTPGARHGAYSGTETAAYPSTPAPETQSPAVGWDTSPPPVMSAPPTETSYQAMGATSQPGYPTTEYAPTASWTDQTATPLASPQPGFQPTQPIPNASWNQTPPTPSLATPQPENVMPGYGTYPAQSNPYVGNQPHAAPSSPGSYAGTSPVTPSNPQQYPGFTPNYPRTGQPSADPYPVPTYPRTAMSPRPAAPNSSMPAQGVSPLPYHPSQPPAPPTTYPPAARSPYAPQGVPAAPTSQPYYGTGASNAASQRSVARLDGTIQEPEVRAAHNDRAQPSYY